MLDKRNGDSNKTIKQSGLEPGATQPAKAKAAPDPELTIASPLPRKAEEIRASEAEVPLEWNVGDVILDLFEVKDIHTGGGMGLVYRVCHRGWNIDLAVKSPRADYFQTEEQKNNFVRECETWINLGLHPHTVSCYYVRTLGGIPRVFAEYVEGGSLSEWIKTRKLYEGGPGKALERIMDIAIQFAWGLHYAHEQGLVHQDVKPANVMMTADGTAKVTDFGLAKARGTAGEAQVAAAAAAGRSILVSFGGMTPAYCSPEQAEGKLLSRKTDIWSWGLSVLEMFTGEVTWLAGQAAAEALEGYLESGAGDETIPRMPEEIVEVLRRCFKRGLDDRLRDMQEVIKRSKEAYLHATGVEYSRPEPKAGQLLADGLNNQAVSLLDLGRHEEAERLFERALQADPQHLEATYNQSLLLWRLGRMTDEVAVARLEEIRKSRGGDWRVGSYLGLVHIERGDGESARRILEQAAGEAPGEEEIHRALEVVRRARGEWHSWLRTFEGHTDGVNSISVSPDGRWALSGSDDKTLRLWELATCQCVRTFEQHTGVVNCVAFSPDGRLALSASEGTLRLWELATGRCVRAFEKHGWYVRSVSISPDGRWALSSSFDQPLRLWELATGRCVRTFEEHADKVRSVSISPDGRLALSGSADRTLRLWELATSQCVRTFEGHKWQVISVCISPDGRWALSGSEDKTLRLWELATGQCIRTLEGHADKVTSVTFSPNGRWVLSGSEDKTLRLWELATSQCVRTFEGHADKVTSVTFSPNGRWALSGSDDNTLRLWELKRCGPRASFAVVRPQSSAEVVRAEAAVCRAQESVRSALKQGDPSRAAAELSRARQVPGYERHDDLLQLCRQIGLHGKIKCLADGWERRTLEGHTSAVAFAAISPDGRWVLSGGFPENAIRFWELATGQCVRSFERYTLWPTCVSISGDGRWALSGGNDSLLMEDEKFTLRLFSVRTGQCVRTFEGHTGGVDSVCISPDGRWALSGSDDKTLRLWELATGRCLRTFEGHTKWVTSISISPDGRWALSGSGDSTLRMWELATGQCVRTIEGHTDRVNSTSISPDGRWVLSGSADKTLRLWKLPTGRCVRTFEGHTDRVKSVSIGPDGRWALSGSADGTLRLWELATGRCVHAFEGHRNEVNSVSISPDGRWALSGSEDKTLRLWELDWECEFPSLADWDEGARPYLESFLSLHTPNAGELPQDRVPSEEDIRLALTHRGKPSWNEQDYDALIRQLQYAGYGWLRPEGVRKKLEEMSKKSEDTSSSVSIFSRLFRKKR